jgi:hypothetical protein
MNAYRRERDIPFTLTHPLADQVTTADTEESAVGLGGNGFGEVGFTSSRRAVEQNTLPRLTLASEQVGELDGKNDGLLQGFLGLLQTSNVFPFDVGLVSQNSTSEGTSELLRLGVLFFAFVFPVVIWLAHASKYRKGESTHFPLPAPFDVFPSEPIALGFFRFVSCSARWFLSFSALSMYSAAFARIISLDFAFFSPVVGVSGLRPWRR